MPVHAKKLPPCDRFPEKRQYETSGEACEAAEKSSKREGIPITYYMCPDCSQYHLIKGRT